MIEEDTVLLLAEMDLAWPDRGVPATDEDAIRIWTNWLGDYDMDTCRQAMRKFGGQQARPPSLAQVLGECRALTGDTLPEGDEVVAEFRALIGRYSSRGPVDPAWFSTPEIGAFAASGAYKEFGDSPDPAYDSDNYASAAAAAAALRRRWDSFAARVDRVGLRAACERLRMEPRIVEAVCGPEQRQIEEAAS